MKYKYVLSFMCVVCMMLNLFSCRQVNKTQENIYIKQEQSFYSDFKVDDGKVYVYCTLLINNTTGNEMNISLVAFLDDDVKNGLLKESKLDGYSLDLKANTFQLQKGENQLDVVFVGEHAGGYKKHDRALPNIEIVEME